MRNVSSYTRTVNGRKIHVDQHTRVGDAAKKVGGLFGRGKRRRRRGRGKSLAKRAWANTKKAVKHGRRRNKKAAAICIGLAVVEIGAYALLNTVAFAMVSVAAIAIGTAMAFLTLANGK